MQKLCICCATDMAYLYDKIQTLLVPILDKYNKVKQAAVSFEFIYPEL